MGCDRGDSFPFDFELKGIPFGSTSKGKLILTEQARKPCGVSTRVGDVINFL